MFRLNTVADEVKSLDLLTPPSDGKPGLVEISGVEMGQKGPVRSVRAANVITCAGLHADQVAGMAGGDPNPKVVTFRGTYYQMKPEFQNICKMNVYGTVRHPPTLESPTT